MVIMKKKSESNGRNGKKILVRRAHNDSGARVLRADGKPSKATISKIRKATQMFAPRYDEHMTVTGHYDQQKSLVSEVFSNGHIGDKILDLGTGTGELARRLINLKRREILDLETRNTHGPIELMLIDFYGPMLGSAAKKLIKLIEMLQEESNEVNMKIFGKSTFGERFEKRDKKIQYKDNRLILKCGNIDLLIINLVKENANQLRRIISNTEWNPDTIIMSYLAHWLRGPREDGFKGDKEKVARSIHDVLISGGKFISIEEYPLVVTIDPDNPVTLKLADAIENATSVLELRELYNIFLASGFEFTDTISPVSKRTIDTKHSMYGAVFVKNTEVSIIPQSDNGIMEK